MTSLFWAILLKPFIALALFALIVIPLELAVKRWMPECKLKRILFFSWRV